jgi:hypothetical protein
MCFHVAEDLRLAADQRRARSAMLWRADLLWLEGDADAAACWLHCDGRR